MITKFDSLFAGHIDMDNVGYAGTAVNDRRFSNERLVTVFEKAQAMAQVMDRLGTIPSGRLNITSNTKAMSVSPTS